MAVINMKDWVKSIILSDQRIAMPIMTHPGIDLTGKTVKDAVTNGQIQFDAIRSQDKKYDLPACMTMMDLTVEAEAFGCEIHFEDHAIPHVTRPLLNEIEQIPSLQVPDLDMGRISEYLKTVRLCAKQFTQKPVLAGCIGPFSLAGRLMDLATLMMGMLISPDEVELLLKKCTDFIYTYIEAFKSNGANGIIMAEPAAGLLSVDLCDQFSSEYIRQIVQALQDDHFLVVLHNCGNTGEVTQSMVNSGAAVLHFGNKIEMRKVLETVPDHILVMGNLDPVGIFKLGTPELIDQATKRLIQETTSYKNFVISSGCDLPPGVPEQNLRAFFDSVDAFRP